MTSLFIHIGTEKTGTTSAQTGFARARDHLRKQGVLYPQSLGLPNHLYLPAACLPENAASRGLLEMSGFKYEGVAQSYLQIAGRWRTHVLYAALRSDRRGRTEAG